MTQMRKLQVLCDSIIMLVSLLVHFATPTVTALTKFQHKFHKKVCEWYALETKQ